MWNSLIMAWEVEYTRLFQVWWDSLSEDEQVEISAKIELLQEFGPVLPRPHADVITTSRHANMKELRGKVRIDICGCCMRSTRGAQPYCSSAAIRRATRAGTRNSCPSQMTFSMIT